MASEARVRVSLDTTRAKGDLKRLVNEGQRAGTRISGAVSGALGRGIQMAGLGAGVGAGIAAVRGAAASGAGSIASDMFGGWGRSFENWLFGDQADQARANKATRDYLAQNFAYAIGGSDGGVPASIKNVANQINAIEKRRQAGISAIERDNDLRISFDEILSKVTTALKEAISDAAKEIAAALNPFGGSR